MDNQLRTQYKIYSLRDNEEKTYLGIRDDEDAAIRAGESYLSASGCKGNGFVVYKSFKAFKVPTLNIVEVEIK